MLTAAAKNSEASVTQIAAYARSVSWYEAGSTTRIV